MLIITFFVIFIYNNNYFYMNLKQIIEESGIGGYSEPKQEMTLEQKKQLHKMVSEYNQVGKKLYEYGDVREIAENLLMVSELAEKYAVQACNEDMLAVGRVQKDMKEIKREASDLRKVASEAWKANERLKASYERIGKILETYYDLQ